jgi:hypothetical protein
MTTFLLLAGAVRRTRGKIIIVTETMGRVTDYEEAAVHMNLRCASTTTRSRAAAREVRRCPSSMHTVLTWRATRLVHAAEETRRPRMRCTRRGVRVRVGSAVHFAPPARVPFPRKQNKVIKCDDLILGMHECSRRCFCNITRLIYYNLFFSSRIDRASHQPLVATFLSSVHYREIFVCQKSTNTCCSRWI